MKKTTFYGNLTAWALVVAACAAFLAWYHTSDLETVAAAIGGSPLVQLGVIASAPLLLFGIGALVGLALVRVKKIALRRGFKRLWRAVGVLGLLVLVVAVLPLVAPGMTGALMWASIVVVYVSMTAPVLIVMLGFAYALGCAGVDLTRRGVLDEYLPDDHFE